MMPKLKRYLPAMVSLFLTISIFVGCEPGGFPTINNQTEQTLTILVSHVRDNGTTDQPVDFGVVPSHSTRKLAGVAFLGDQWVNRFQAVDSLGNVIFSHDYKLADLKKLDWVISVRPQT